MPYTLTLANNRLFPLFLGWWVFLAQTACQPGATQTPTAQPASVSSPTGGKILKGMATRIIDGDTFDLLLSDQASVRIRLYGTDSPERGQAFYQQAKDYLGGLLKNRKVTVAVRYQDPYGRKVGIVFAGQDNINEQMIQSGMAWQYIRFDKNPAWKAMQQAASAGKRGLWADQHPTAPWDWKSERRRENAHP